LSYDLTIKLDLFSVNVNRHANIVGQTDSHTHTHTHNGPMAPPGPQTSS